MLNFLRIADRASERKLRLFAAACCRRIWPLLSAARARKAVVVAEGFADGRATRRQLLNARSRARQAAVDAVERSARSRWPVALSASRLSVAEFACDLDRGRLSAACEAAASAAAAAADGGGVEALRRERTAQSVVLRDVFGPLAFRPVHIEPDWLRWSWATVPAIAGHIYQERAFQELPILADALTDAGCDNQEVIDHCRHEGPHVRGCWVVDLLLGRE
jgi:hypothetical protein